MGFFVDVANSCTLVFKKRNEISSLIIFSFVDEFDDDKAPSRTHSRKGTAETIKSTGSIESRKNPFRRNIMSVDNMKVENVDKSFDEIDKSKLAPPVIVRGPMPKIVSFIKMCM